jgi:hypothetical protein
MQEDGMVKTNILPAIASITFLALSTSAPAQAQQSSISFFVTSVGPGKGGDLGGLEGADRHCQSLAQAVGAGGKTWRAYLSTQGTGAVNARDRIGKGPWQNAKGIVIANDVAELHGANNLNKQTALTERATASTAWAIRPTGMTCLPVRRWTVPRSLAPTIAHARTGQAAPKALRCSAISIGAV